MSKEQQPDSGIQDNNSTVANLTMIQGIKTQIKAQKLSVTTVVAVVVVAVAMVTAIAVE